MRFCFSIAFILSCLIGYNQIENVSDLSFIKDKLETQGENAKQIKRNYYYLPDTLTIPFVDDFSTNKFKNYPLIGTDSLITSYYKSFDGLILPDASFTLDTTYYFTYSIDSVGDTIVNKTILNDTLVIFSTDTVFINVIDTVPLYPKYNIQDSSALGLGVDTILFTTNLNKTDSTIWSVIPPDAPNAKIWLNNNVYITNTFAVEPPSIGAAVFEGLDSLGQPYSTIVESYGVADKLTSKPINLSNIGASQQLFLVFYFQPQGLGANPPNSKDSLILEFKTGTTNWQTQWFALGAKYKPFEKVSFPVDSKFFTNDFQFRFKNYATLSGNLDIWLLDYVKLSKTTEINDVAMSEKQSSFLKNYSSVPWSHYVSKPEVLKEDLLFKVQNNFTTTAKNVQFDALILDNFGSTIFEFTDNNLIVNPGISFSEGLKHSAFTQFPVNTNDSSTFEIISFINSGGDALSANDTVRFSQKFHNYYAYDDGTAETGYSLSGTNNGEVAYQFLALKSDSLRAVQMYFNKSLANNIGVEFDLMVWDDFNAPPLIQQLDTTKYYGINNFVTYKLKTPIKIGGTFYVGWKQRSKVELNIGLDRNDTLDNKLFFNQNGWSSSSIIGAPMIRPVFGSDFILGDDELEVAHQFTVYPNPNSGVIYIESDFEIDKTEVLDMLGNKVLSGIGKNKMDVSDLPNSIYFLRIYSKENIITKKIIKQ